MTIKECIITELDKLEQAYKPVNWKSDFLEFVEFLDDITYEEIIQEKDSYGLMFKIFLEGSKAYGMAKWQEAITASIQAITEDSPCPPVFIN
ncbi:MAG: hypothetical protein LC105_06010 [Chitinophagales bacterium]|nr:hypothetical protein [Chitinophagales bacterium]